MADIALATADKINVGTSSPNVQHTFIAASAVTAGSPVYIVAATGKVAHSDGNGAGVIASCFGIALRTAAAGEAVTVLRRGLLEGYVLAGNFGTAVYVSDTVGTLADAAGTTSIKVGIVVPLNGTVLGTTADKGLLVELNSDLG